MGSRNSFMIAPALVLLTSCHYPFDFLGVEEIVTESSSIEAPDAIADDRIEDKHPICDPSLVVEERFYRDACTFTLDKSCAITKLDILPFEQADEYLEQRVYRSYLDAAEALFQREVLPSMEVVNA